MKLFKVTVAITAALALTSLGAAQEKSKAQIQKMYDVMTMLGKSVNIEKLVLSFRNSTTPDFKYVDAQKSTFGRDNYIGQIRDQYKKIYKVHSLTNNIVAIKIKGKDVYCTVKSTYDITAAAPPRNRAVGWSTSMDVWTKTSKGWKMKSTTTLKEGIAKKA